MKPIEKSIVDLMASSLKEAVNEKVTAYDTTAKVLRVENSTAWVHIPGGVQETPVSKTIDCKPGDTVQVRISGHSATLTGNATVPPTGDAEAIKAATKAGLAQIKAAAAAIDISAIVTALTTNENGIDSDGNVISNILQTMVRPYETGVLVGQVGNSPCALVNAHGSFDVVEVEWDGDVPTVPDNGRLAFFGETAELTKIVFDDAANSNGDPVAFQSDILALNNDLQAGLTSIRETETIFGTKTNQVEFMHDDVAYSMAWSMEPNGHFVLKKV